MSTCSRFPIILTGYPLSASFERALRDSFGPQTQTVTAAQLRANSSWGLVKHLWSLRGAPMVLPVEEDHSAVLLPVLKLLAACTRSREICVVRPDLKREAVGRLRIAQDVVRFVGASIACRWAARRSQRELAVLVNQPRQPAKPLPAGGGVLYLKTNLWFGIKAGGSIGHIAGVVNALQRGGHPVSFASAEPPVMIDPGVRLMNIPAPSAFGLPYELNNYRFQQNFQQARPLHDTLKSTQLIYQRLSAANYLGAVLSRQYQVPLVVEYNGSEVWVAKNWGRGLQFHELATMAEEAMLRHAHLVVTVSDVLRDELIERGVEAGRVVSYPNCIDPNVFDPARFTAEQTAALRRQHGIAEDALLVTFVGTFGQWHGAEKLAEAIARLWREQPEWLARSKMHFLFVGDGLTRPLVEQIIRDAGAQSLCTHAGLVPQPQAPLYLAASDILASPHVPNADGSRFFGSPTKLFEYMAMAKPILASDLEQIGEVLRPGLRVGDWPSEGPTPASRQVALMARPGEVDDLVDGLRFLAMQPEWRRTLAANARAVALEKYTWDKHVQVILDALPQEARA